MPSLHTLYPYPLSPLLKPIASSLSRHSYSQRKDSRLITSSAVLGFTLFFFVFFVFSRLLDAKNASRRRTSKPDFFVRGGRSLGKWRRGGPEKVFAIIVGWVDGGLNVVAVEIVISESRRIIDEDVDIAGRSTYSM
jgi:hypothetical protein